LPFSLSPRTCSGGGLRGSCYIAHGSLLAAHRLFVYSVQMTRLPCYSLFLSLFLLAACDSDKNAFMTPKPYEPVVDVNLDEYSVNGNVIGKIDNDISASDDLLIESLDNELRRIRDLEQEEALRNGKPADEVVVAKLHVDGNLSFGDFFKIIATTGFSGYTSIQYVIGDNFDDVYNVQLPTSSRMCYCFAFIVRNVTFARYKYGHHRSKLLLNEILSADNHQRKIEIDCFKDYNVLDLLLTFYDSKDERTYVISLNEGALKENPSFDGFTYYSFNNLADLWKFIADIRSKEKMINREDCNKSEKCKGDNCTRFVLGKQMTLAFQKNALMKDLAPLIKGLNAYGYNGDGINFSVVRE